MKHQSVWLGLRQGVFTCVMWLWQVTMCDPVWKMTYCICEMGFH